TTPTITLHASSACVSTRRSELALQEAAGLRRPHARFNMSDLPHSPAADRYDRMLYRRCGRSGLKLPAISLGAWETFGGYRDAAVARACITRAFDLGITHFDFAN